MKLPLAAFLLSLAGLAFALGLVVGAYEVFPYHQIKYVLNSVERVIADRDRLISNMPTALLAERRHAGTGLTINDQSQTSPGLTLLSGFFTDTHEIRLIEMDGTIARRWPVSFLELFPDTEHIFPREDIPASDWNTAVHGLVISPDGSIVFNFDGDGTVKLDRCGKTVWTVSRMTHHSVDKSADGSYWVPSQHLRTDPSDAYPHFATQYKDDTIMRISADGAVLSEISVLQILIDNGLYSLLVANGRFTSEMGESDVLHMNDIEELTVENLSGFPDFAAGDLLLSLRNLNLLLVVDPGDWSVKWRQSGPWLRQHDPDFQPDGRITVLNNNSDDTKIGNVLGGSNLMSVRPQIPGGAVSKLYGDKPGQDFFTNTQGKHQLLDNGNILVADHFGGRAFEINSQGDIVWQYVVGYDDQYVGKITDAERYPEDYFTVRDWACPEP